MKAKRNARLDLRIPKELKDDFTLLIENDKRYKFASTSDAVIRMIAGFVDQNGRQLSLIKAQLPLREPDKEN